MIRLNDEQFKSTLKELSKDNTNNEYMTESNEIAINFDKVKDVYIKDVCPKNKPTSNDALKYIGDEFYFIEFKNGNIKNVKNIRDKVFESLLMFSDITGNTISYTRNKGNYILVYNYDKSKEYIKKEMEKKNIRDCDEKLDSYEVQDSPNFTDFLFALSDLARYNIDFFGLKASFEKMYFNTVKTYDVNEFETEFVSRCCNILNEL